MNGSRAEPERLRPSVGVVGQGQPYGAFGGRELSRRLAKTLGPKMRNQAIEKATMKAPVTKSPQS